LLSSINSFSLISLGGSSAVLHADATFLEFVAPYSMDSGPPFSKPLFYEFELLLLLIWAIDLRPGFFPLCLCLVSNCPELYSFRSESLLEILSGAKFLAESQVLSVDSVLKLAYILLEFEQVHFGLIQGWDFLVCLPVPSLLSGPVAHPDPLTADQTLGRPVTVFDLLLEPD
jgi:hypothetical protein